MADFKTALPGGTHKNQANQFLVKNSNYASYNEALSTCYVILSGYVIKMTGI
jgi:hypothetical protein